MTRRQKTTVKFYMIIDDGGANYPLYTCIRCEAEDVDSSDIQEGFKYCPMCGRKIQWDVYKK